jgi:hypothetical protein
MAQERAADEQKAKAHKPQDKERQEERASGSEMDRTGLAGLQQLVGNRAVQRLIAPRSDEGSRGDPAVIQRHVPQETTEDLRWSMGMIDEGLNALAQAPQGTEEAQQSIAMGRFGAGYALDSIEAMPGTEGTGEAAGGAVPSPGEMPLRPIPSELAEGGSSGTAVPSEPTEGAAPGGARGAAPSASEMPLRPMPSELTEGAAPGGAGGAVPSPREMPLRPMPSELAEGGSSSTAVPSASEMPLKPMPSELAEGGTSGTAVPSATKMPLKPMPPEWE